MSKILLMLQVIKKIHDNVLNIYYGKHGEWYGINLIRIEYQQQQQFLFFKKKLRARVTNNNLTKRVIFIYELITNK